MFGAKNLGKTNAIKAKLLGYFSYLPLHKVETEIFLSSGLSVYSKVIFFVKIDSSSENLSPHSMNVMVFAS